MDLIEKPLPASEEAEIAVLGACLQDKDAVTITMEIIENEKAFYRQNHEHIFLAMKELYQDGESVDVLTVGETLRKRGRLEEIGGLYHLTELVARVPSAANIEYYARIVDDKYKLRQLVVMAQEMALDCLKIDSDSKKIFKDYGERIFELQNNGQRDEWTTLAQESLKAVEMLQARMASPDKVFGIPTGYKEIDEIIGGFQNSDLIVFGGRPSHGKSAWMMKCAHNIAMWGGFPIVFSIEMSNQALALRELGGHAKVNSLKMKTLKYFTTDDLKALVTTLGKNAEAWDRIKMQDTSYVTPMSMMGKIKKLCVKNPGILEKAIVFIDYTQIISTGKKFATRDAEVSWISMRLKGLAKYFNIPVVSFAQLNRAVETTDDKIPRRHHLRESGGIEQDADLIMFIMRPEVYNPLDQPGIAKIIIDKHRNGPVGTVDLQFTKEFMMFHDLAKSFPSDERKGGNHYQDDYEPRQVYYGSDGQPINHPF